MYDNNIKLLSLIHLRDNIESIDITYDSDTLIAIIKLFKRTTTCAVCKTNASKFNCYKIKKIIHSISTQKPCIIHFKQRRYQSYWHKSEILEYLLSIDDELNTAYRLKERYREFNLTADYETCNDELNDLIYEFRNSGLESFRSFGKTLENWKDEIKNSLVRINGRRLSNGPIESTNSKIKTIIKTSNGIKDFDRFRNRVLYSINKDLPIQNK